MKVGNSSTGLLKEGTVDAVIIIRLEGNQKLYCEFINLEKSFNRIPVKVCFVG